MIWLVYLHPMYSFFQCYVAYYHLLWLQVTMEPVCINISMVLFIRLCMHLNELPWEVTYYVVSRFKSTVAFYQVHWSGKKVFKMAAVYRWHEVLSWAMICASKLQKCGRKVFLLSLMQSECKNSQGSNKVYLMHIKHVNQNFHGYVTA